MRLVLFEKTNYNELGGVVMDYMTLKAASEDSLLDKLLLLAWPCSRCCKNDNRLVDTQRF